MSDRLAPTAARLRRALLVALVCFVALFSGAIRSSAQVVVNIALSRHSYILYEPIIATVGITNNAGRDLEFADVPGKPWLNIEVSTEGERQLPPSEPDYKLSPLTLPAGKTATRQIDLTPIFPIRDMGTHHISANVYLAEADRYYASSSLSFELTEGRVLWSQAVGDGRGDVRQMSLLTHRLLDKILLYVRVRDQDGPNVYTTQSIGRVLLTGSEPEAVLDRRNWLHIVHEAVPRGYYYTVIDPDGNRVTQKVYTSEGRSRPHLVKLDSGEVSVEGGRAQTNTASAAEATSPTRGFNGPSQPKLSDRPQGLPPATRQGGH